MNFHKPLARFVRVFVNVAKAKIKAVIKTWTGSRKVVEVQGWKDVYWNDAKKRDPRHFNQFFLKKIIFCTRESLLHVLIQKYLLVKFNHCFLSTFVDKKHLINCLECISTTFLLYNWYLWVCIAITHYLIFFFVMLTGQKRDSPRMAELRPLEIEILVHVSQKTKFGAGCSSTFVFRHLFLR